MAKLSFKTLEFEHHGPDKHDFDASGDFVRVTFLRNFYFDIPDEDLGKIGKYKVSKNSISFDVSEKRADHKFNNLLVSGFGRLVSKLTGKKTIYIHKNSGIPLYGNNAFGIIDRNSSLIEIKPVTGCNIDCIYCSVNQARRGVDFVVEKDYLVDELKNLIDFKNAKKIQVFIGSQGETLFYADLVELVKDISKIKKINEIILSTNGTLLTEKLINELAKAGLTRINLSLNALDEKLSRKICGPGYNLRHVKKMALLIVKKMDLMITPVLVPGINDAEIPKLIQYAVKIGAGRRRPAIGIQKFLEYRFGKNPVKEESWEKFYEKMAEYEKKFNVKLLRDVQGQLDIVPTVKLPKPFDRGDVVKATIVCEGRLPGEKIAVAHNRSISIMDCPAEKHGAVRVLITRSKHNVFVGKLA